MGEKQTSDYYGRSFDYAKGDAGGNLGVFVDWTKLLPEDTAAGANATRILTGVEVPPIDVDSLTNPASGSKSIFQINLS